MTHLRQTLWAAAAVCAIAGVTVELGAQKPAGAQTWASVAQQLEEERNNEALQRVPPFKVFDNLYYVGVGYTGSRSEEHTSELQSQSNLVCRLLLEKKKSTTNNTYRQK